MNVYVLSLLIGFMSLVLLWIIRRKKKLSIFIKNGIPGPKPDFWFGNMKEYAKKKAEFEFECQKKYGNIFGFFVGPKPFVVIADPDLLKKIQVEEFRFFSNKDPIIPDGGVPHPIIFNSLPILKDNEWRISRSISNPSFTVAKIKQMSYKMKEAIDDFIEIIKRKSERNEEFNIYSLYKNLLLDIMSRTCFGVISDIQKGKNNKFLESVAKVLSADSAALLALLSICFPEIEPIPTKLRRLVDIIKNYVGYPSIKYISDTIDEFIQQRKQSSEMKDDLLQNLIEEKLEFSTLNTKMETLSSRHVKDREREKVTDKRDNSKNVISLSDERINGIAFSYLVGGYDTTSTTLAYATYYLAEHAEIQERAREEVKSVVDNKENIDFEDLNKFTYLDQIISETLRLHHFLTLATSRIVKKTIEHNGMTIPKDVTVLFPVVLLHRDPTNWPNPDKFDPERFSYENKPNINAYKYQPFGNGPRACVGMRFAQTVMKLTLANLLLCCKFEKSRNFDLTNSHSIFSIHPKEVIIQADCK